LVGLLGDSAGVSIVDSYATGSVISENNEAAGGLIGRIRMTQATISRCYATGSVSGNGNVGGFIGYDGGSTTYTANFWNISINSGLPDIGNLGDVEGITAKTTAQMKQRVTYVDWDFTNIWGIVEGSSYPYLLWQGTPPIPPVAIDGINAPTGLILAQGSDNDFLLK
jgi:hypothetical protein